jgi:hypothetical protein
VNEQTNEQLTNFLFFLHYFPLLSVCFSAQLILDGTRQAQSENGTDYLQQKPYWLTFSKSTVIRDKQQVLS